MENFKCGMNEQKRCFGKNISPNVTVVENLAIEGLGMKWGWVNRGSAM